MAHYCYNHPSECSGFLSRLSSYNKRAVEDEDKMFVLAIFNLVVVFLSIAFFYFFRSIQSKIYANAGFFKFGLDEYTVLVENIPLFLYEDLKTYP